jgi:heme O synthase-like polyprenyltransferase
MAMLPWPVFHSSLIYWCGVLLSLAFLYFGSEFALERSRLAARRLLAASIVYLPLLFALRVGDAAFQM